MIGCTLCPFSFIDKSCSLLLSIFFAREINYSFYKKMSTRESKISQDSLLILNAHLGVFITCVPNYRLVNSCSKFWSETGKLPTIIDIVNMCKKTKGFADQQLAANILGQ